MEHCLNLLIQLETSWPKVAAAAQLVLESRRARLFMRYVTYSRNPRCQQLTAPVGLPLGGTPLLSVKYICHSISRSWTFNRFWIRVNASSFKPRILFWDLAAKSDVSPHLPHLLETNWPAVVAATRAEVGGRRATIKRYVKSLLSFDGERLTTVIDLLPWQLSYSWITISRQATIKACSPYPLSSWRPTGPGVFVATLELLDGRTTEPTGYVILHWLCIVYHLIMHVSRLSRQPLKIVNNLEAPHSHHVWVPTHHGCD